MGIEKPSRESSSEKGNFEDDEEFDPILKGQEYLNRRRNQLSFNTGQEEDMFDNAGTA